MSHRAPLGASSNELEEEGEGGLEDANGEEGVEDAAKDEPFEGGHVGAEDAREGHAHQQRDQNLDLRNLFLFYPFSAIIYVFPPFSGQRCQRGSQK